MKETRSSLRYAKAILELAKKVGSETEVNNDMKLIVDTIAGSDDLKRMLKSPVINARDKNRILIALFGKKINSIVKGLFNLLEENKRMMILESIAKQYAVIYDYHKRIQVAKIITATPLTVALKEKILARIVKLTGKKVSMEDIVNPEILGGFILRVGDLQYDASISNQFNELKKEFDDSHYIPKI